MRVRVRQFQFWLSDLLLLAGLGCSIGSSACDTLEYLVGGMTNFSHPGEYLGKVRVNAVPEPLALSHTHSLSLPLSLLRYLHLQLDIRPGSLCLSQSLSSKVYFRAKADQGHQPPPAIF